MKRQRMISEGALARLRQGAVAAWQRQDYPEYFKIMEQASRQDPANSGLLLDMGAAVRHALRIRRGGAAALRKPSASPPNKSNALIMAGTQCRGFDRYEMARHYFELALKDPVVSPTRVSSWRRFTSDSDCWKKLPTLVERALRLDPACALATLVGARLDRLSGRLEEAERRLRPLLAQSAEDTWSTRIRGWYELGAVLDAQGRYDEAMAAFLEAKTMILPNARAIHLLSEAGAFTLENRRNKSWTRRWWLDGETRAADLGLPCRLALLCGHPRSGTTLLEQVLDSHPEFVSAEETAIFLRESYWSLLRGMPRTL
jgi:tetratricopeptide (TPR) repeat protein